MDKFTESDIERMCMILYYCNYEFVKETDTDYELYQKIFEYLWDNDLI